MNKRTEYVNRVKAGIEIKKAMEAMEDNGALVFEYGTRGTYEIHCSGVLLCMVDQNKLNFYFWHFVPLAQNQWTIT